MSVIGKLHKTTKSGGVCLDEYNENYSIMSAWVNRDEEIKPNMCTVNFKGEDKKVALKISLGNKDRAIEILQELLSQLGYEIHQGENRDEQDSPPF